MLLILGKFVLIDAIDRNVYVIFKKRNVKPKLQVFHLDSTNELVVLVQTILGSPFVTLLNVTIDADIKKLSQLARVSKLNFNIAVPF